MSNWFSGVFPANQKNVVWRDHKRQGEWAELRFMAAALDHGFNVMRPWGDSSRFDLVLEKNSLFFRIQVKSTGRWDYLSRRNQGKPVYGFRTYRSDNSTYLPSEIDFYALYVIPDDLWYLVPPRALCGRHGVCVCPKGTGFRYEKYCEAWHLLGDEQARVSPAGITIHGCAEDDSAEVESQGNE